MPLINRDHPLFPMVQCFDEHGEMIGVAAAADTDEGWLDVHVLRSAKGTGLGRVLVDRKLCEQVHVRVHTNYELRHRKTGEVLFKVKWDGAGNKIQ